MADLSYGWRCCTGYRQYSLNNWKRIMSHVELQPGFDFQQA
ncbi:D-arabinose 5-phosphate isomerase, partial [Escherichia coli]